MKYGVPNIAVKKMNETLLSLEGNALAGGPESFYDFEVLFKEQIFKLSEFKDCVTVVVNVASE